MTTNPNIDVDNRHTFVYIGHMEETPMFERTLEEMTAVITVESEMFQALTASNVGFPVALIGCGAKEYSFTSAIEAINAFDRILPNCPKGLYKRIRATRMQFVFAFGPDMMEVTPAPPVRLA